MPCAVGVSVRVRVKVRVTVRVTVSVSVSVSVRVSVRVRVRVRVWVTVGVRVTISVRVRVVTLTVVMFYILVLYLRCGASSDVACNPYRCWCPSSHLTCGGACSDVAYNRNYCCTFSYLIRVRVGVRARVRVCHIWYRESISPLCRIAITSRSPPSAKIR